MLLAALFALHQGNGDDFTAAWAGVEATIRDEYYAREDRRSEMEGLLARYAPLARAAPTRADFAGTVNRMAAEFRDSHFEFDTDADQAYYLADGLVSKEGAPMPQIGAWFRAAPDGGWTLRMLLDGGAAAKAGLREGDVIRTIEGAPFTPIASLAPFVGRVARIGYVRDGVAGEALVKVTRTPGLRMFLDATMASRHTIARGEKRFAVVRVWTFGNETFAHVLRETIFRAKSMDGLIVDLRGGFGGYVEPFLNPLVAYRRPLALIVDGGSRSAKEVVSYALQSTGRARIVGARTAGHVLGTFPHRINAWSYLEIPEMDLRINGARLEGRGVIPDVPVASGGDAVARAADVLAHPASAPPPPVAKPGGAIRIVPLWPGKAPRTTPLPATPLPAKPPTG